MKHAGDINLNGNDINNVGSIDAPVGSLNNVDETGVANGDVLVYNSTSGNWECATQSGGATVLNDLTDVTTSTPAGSHILIYDGATYANRTGYATDFQMSSGDTTLISAKILSMVGDIANNAADIVTNASSIVTNYNATVANAAAIASNDADIAALNTTVSNHTTLITANDADIATNATNIATNSGNITTNAAAIIGVQNNLTTHTANLNNHTDVSAAAPATNDVLTWSGTQWAPAAPSAAPTAGTGIEVSGSTVGVDYTGANNIVGSCPNSGLVADYYADTVLLNDGTNTVKVTLEDLFNDSLTEVTLGMLGNVTTTGKVNGSELYYDGANWKVGSGVNLMSNGTMVNTAGSVSLGSTVLRGLFSGLTLTSGKVYMLNPSTQTLEEADANAASGWNGMICVCTDQATDGSQLCVNGIVKTTTNTSTLKKGDIMYMSETAGEVTATAPTTSGSIVRVLGHLVDPTRGTILLNPSPDYFTVE